MTPTVCDACGGDAERKETCFWCERTGMMTPERFALYRASREQRVTGQYQAWNTIVADTVEIIRERNTPFTDKLASEGTRLLKLYDNAVAMGASHAERTRAITELREYHERVMGYLARRR